MELPKNESKTKAENEQLRQENQALRVQIKELKEQIKVMQHRIFGARSEKSVPDAENQLSL